MTSDEQQQTLSRLRGYLAMDPENAPLLRDCADAAGAAGDLAFADECFSRLAVVKTLSDEETAAAAVAAIRNGRVARAIELLGPLVEANPADAALRFNLAWALALDRQFDSAADLLDDATVGALPQAAMLALQLRHQQGDFDGAGERMLPYLAMHGAYPPLQAAVSVLALDLDDEDLARQAASAAGDHPDALTTLATLAISDGETDAAHHLLDRAQANGGGQSPRMWMAMGLVNLRQGATADALQQMDQAAEMFGNHLGSWIATGWAYLTAGDQANAKLRFQRAMALDGNFAECHGSIATIQALEGDRDAASHSIRRAIALDRQCFSAAFARLVLATSENDPDQIAAIVDRAFDSPINDKGQTLGQLLGRMAR